MILKKVCVSVGIRLGKMWGEKIRADREAVVDKLRQDEKGSLEPSGNLQQLRRQTSAVVNVDMLGTGKERQWT